MVAAKSRELRIYAVFKQDGYSYTHITSLRPHLEHNQNATVNGSLHFC